MKSRDYRLRLLANSRTVIETIKFYEKAKCKNKVVLEVLEHRLSIKEMVTFKVRLVIKDRKLCIKMIKLKLILKVMIYMSEILAPF